ncbi:hypothetical protein DVH24_000469 [Malus domestica]|uniref:Uncharacterized protein n=1 Tax=Malus domestica TaxID=3750 RepID=A0A498J014_MALDO|nr:hypothetical protein DVH24_000469 [Malus domestica]
MDCVMSVSNLAFFGSQIGFSRCPTSLELQTRCFVTGKTIEPVEFSSVLQFDSIFYPEKLMFPGEFYSFLSAEEDDENISGELATLGVVILPATKRKVIEKICRKGPPKLLWPPEAGDGILHDNCSKTSLSCSPRLTKISTSKQVVSVKWHFPPPYCAIEISRFLREPALSFAITLHLYYLRSLLRALQSLLRHPFLRASSVISSPATLLQIFPTEKTQIIIIYSSSPQTKCLFFYFLFSGMASQHRKKLNSGGNWKTLWGISRGIQGMMGA